MRERKLKLTQVQEHLQLLGLKTLYIEELVLELHLHSRAEFLPNIKEILRILLKRTIIETGNDMILIRRNFMRVCSEQQSWNHLILTFLDLHRYDRDAYNGRNRQLSPYQGPRRNEMDYASNDFQIKKERNRGRR